MILPNFRLRNNILHIKELRIKLEKDITLKFNEKNPSCTHFKLVTLSLERKKMVGRQDDRASQENICHR